MALVLLRGRRVAYLGRPAFALGREPAIAIKFAVSGQNCIAANRIFVERPVYEKHRLAFGMVAVNTATFTGAPIPFGGGKASGLGREGGIEGFDPFVETKYVCLGHLGLPQPQDACVSNASSD